MSLCNTQHLMDFCSKYICRYVDILQRTSVLFRVCRTEVSSSDSTCDGFMCLRGDRLAVILYTQQTVGNQE